jgi:hypothetical protein
MNICWFFVVLDKNVWHKKSEIDFFLPRPLSQQNLTTNNLVIMNTNF